MSKKGSASLFASLALLSALVFASRTEALQSPSPSATTYWVSGPAIVRLTDNRNLDFTIPTISEGRASLDWKNIQILDEASFTEGWRIRNFLCDAQAANVCLVERRMGNQRQRAVVNLASPGSPQWQSESRGEILDFHSASGSVLRRTDIPSGTASITLESLEAGGSVRSIWSSDPANRNADARFLRTLDGERTILLATGGPTAHWQLITDEGSSPLRSAPGLLSAAFVTDIYFLSLSPDRLQSSLGRTALAASLFDWGVDSLVYQGEEGVSPAVAAFQTPGDLIPADKSAVFLPNGGLLAITRNGSGLSLSEICRSGAEGTVQARTIEATRSWFEGTVRASFRGGAPSSRIALVSTTDLGGNIGVKAVILATPDGQSQAIQPCGQTRVATVDLPLPSSPGPADLVRSTHTVASSDGVDVTYDVIERRGQSGEVMIRPYGAYGAPIQSYLARPVEQQWVAQGNRLVIPRLRGDAGDEAWIAAGRGDLKRQSTDDLLAVTRDVIRRMQAVERVNLLGISAGGFVAAKAALNHPELFDRVVLVAGVTDLNLTEARDPQSFDRAEFGSVEGGFSVWLGGERAGDVRPRFIVLHGDSDTIVPAQSSASFAQYARGLGYVVQGQRYQGVGHELANRNDLLADIKALW